MCSDLKILLVVLAFLAVSCSTSRTMQKIRSGEVRMDISVPDEKPLEDERERDVRIDDIRSELSDCPIIMNAIRDSETGEMVATDVIAASTVVARFRNVAERAGYVSISFDVNVPAEMASSDWQLKLRPYMKIMDDIVQMDPVFITGERYREAQLKGYQRYRQFLASIITDTTDLVRVEQLELFIQRYYPDTYAMKTDSSLVSDPVAKNLFGVTQAEALRHYTRQLKVRANQRRKSRVGQMYGKYVKDPIITEGIRLDTVLTSSDGDFTYRYLHTFRSRPSLKKVNINLIGEIYEDGEKLQSLPFPEDLTFYISSLSTLADYSTKYMTRVLYRNVYDHTKALIDFEKNSHVIDTSLSDNASELKRIVRCIDDVLSHQEYELDSLIIKASCSPEGTYVHNMRLASARSSSIREYLWEQIPLGWRKKVRTSHVPENWEQLKALVAHDSLLAGAPARKMLTLMEDLGNPDEVEGKLAEMPQYRYLREKVYPQLRSVSFDFHLHRVGMQQDTVHTEEIDTLYMAGLEAMRNLDYKVAVEKLRSYRDYNSALAFMSADYNHSALNVLEDLDDKDAKVCYMKAVVLSRLGAEDEAMKYFELCIAYDPYMEHRANLDPEMAELVKRRQNNINQNEYEY